MSEDILETRLALRREKRGEKGVRHVCEVLTELKKLQIKNVTNEPILEG
jgi:hypothetical protein